MTIPWSILPVCVSLSAVSVHVFLRSLYRRVQLILAQGTRPPATEMKYFSASDRSSLNFTWNMKLEAQRIVFSINNTSAFRKLLLKNIAWRCFARGERSRRGGGAGGKRALKDCTVWSYKLAETLQTYLEKKVTVISLYSNLFLTISAVCMNLLSVPCSGCHGDGVGELTGCSTGSQRWSRHQRSQTGTS